ncbi:hypothetical protein ACEPAH_7791 [Sanghuangporus vaninii]
MPPGLLRQDAKVLRKVKNRTDLTSVSESVECNLGGLLSSEYSWLWRRYQCVVHVGCPDGFTEHCVLLNNAFSEGVGLIPLVGVVGVATFKANSLNAALLEEFLCIRAEEFLKSQRAQAEDNGEGQGKGGGK